MKFDENITPYYIFDRDQYETIKKDTSELTKGDFTFIVNVNPNWDSMEYQKKYSPIAIEGQHIGIFFVKERLDSDEEGFFGKMEYWTYDGEYQYNDRFIDIRDENTDDIWAALTFKKNEKLIELHINNLTLKESFSTELMDYSKRRIWIGASSNHSKNHQYDFPFIGEINHTAIFQKYINQKEFKSIISNDYRKNIIEHDDICFYTDFSQKTQCKVRDLSGMGNNLVISDYDFMQPRGI